jgi:hypothetical protein
LGGTDAVGVTYPGLGTIINLDVYEGSQLSTAKSGDLLNTVTHEFIHWDFYTRGQSKDPDNQDVDGKGYVYDEADRRTPEELKNQFNEFRKSVCEDKKKNDPSVTGGGATIGFECPGNK